MIRWGSKFVFAGLVAVLFLLSQQSVLAQNSQGRTNEMKRDTMHQHGTTMSHPMGEEMSQVRSECQKTDRSAGTALSEIRSAKSSSDPKVLKDALDKAEKQLSEIQSNMAHAMRMMGNMHGNTQMQGEMHPSGRAGSADTMEVPPKAKSK